MTVKGMWASPPGNAGWCRGSATLPAMLVFQTRAPDLSTADIWGFPWGLSGKESACQRRRPKFDPWVRKIPWKRKWQPTPVFCLGNPMDRGAWWATVHGVAKEMDMTERLNGNC